MKKAYTALQQEGLMRAPLNIEATHLYVRFLPKDSADLETLKKDTTLDLFSYPLVYELSEGEKYIDSTLIGNDFTWLYTKVPVGYTSPISGYEIIEELYMPMEETSSQQVKQQRAKSSVAENWDILLSKSMELTGNSKANSISAPNGMQKASAQWRPYASIKVWDDILAKNIPLKGVKVRARNILHWDTGYTDANGVVLLGFFNWGATYSIAWEGQCWDIRDGMFLQAYYNGPSDTKSNWSLNIDNGKSKAYAHAHRACWTMFCDENLGAGISWDKHDNFNFWMGHQKISVYDKDGGDKSGINYGANWVGFSQIGIYMKSTSAGNPYYQSHQIFGTTVHELAHTMHIYE
jgi:hypothetical protein